MKQIAVWKVLLLTLITFGFYAIFWVARNRDYLVNQKGKKYTVPSWVWLLTIPIIFGAFVVAIFIVSIMGAFAALTPEAAGNTILVLGIAAEVVTLVVGLWWLWHFGAVIEKVTQGRISRFITVLLYLFIGPFVILFHQYYINRLGQNKKGVTYKASSGLLMLVVLSVVLGLLGSVGSTYSLNGDIETIKNDIRSWQEAVRAENKKAELLEQKIDRLNKEYLACVDDLDKTYPNEEIQPDQQAAYEKAYDTCDLIYKDYEAAYNESIGE